MDSMYDDYYKKALDLQYHFHDVVDNHADPRMQALQHEVHSLVDDLKEHKRPRSVEERRIIDHQLLEARTSGGALMSNDEVEGLHHSYQHMRDDIRRLPEY
jgi:hypothetical protein